MLSASFITKVWMMVDVVTTIPNTPVDGPEPVPETFVPTAVWIVLSFVGTASDCFIGALPYFDAQCCLSTHAGIVTVAAALVTCGIYSADSLVNKIFGPNLPAHYQMEWIRLPSSSRSHGLGRGLPRTVLVGGCVVRGPGRICCIPSSCVCVLRNRLQPLQRRVLRVLHVAHSVGVLVESVDVQPYSPHLFIYLFI
ncbi:uncharacterized protein LOC119400940 [Rhipicephalus sanguineus]|uniref:uncharacterized protein LOC119400940 n=1 Tax=Rhipicephalus sanguineus TaxID=34632 RepID=UPI0018957711|nr:uncharacterized protein LOC119400940 [Rhipicephalus sanguineus]